MPLLFSKKEFSVNFVFPIAIWNLTVDLLVNFKIQGQTTQSQIINFHLIVAWITWKPNVLLQREEIGPCGYSVVRRPAEVQKSKSAHQFKDSNSSLPPLPRTNRIYKAVGIIWTLPEYLLQLFNHACYYFLEFPA